MPVSEKALKHLPRSERVGCQVDRAVLFLLRALALCVVAPTPPSWNKVTLIRKLIATYDLVVWVDADAVVVDLSRDIASEFQTDKWLHIVEIQPPSWGTHLNAGVFAVRSGPTTASFFREVAQLTPFKHHPWWEQAAMLHLLGYDLWPARKARKTSYSDGVALIDKSWNSTPLDPSPAPRIKHYAGVDNESRSELIGQDVARVTAAFRIR